MRAAPVVMLLALVALAGCGAAPRRPRRAHAPRTVPLGVPHRRPPAGAALRRLRRIGLPVFCGGRHGAELALTFDDGPGPYTPIALRLLRRYHERATFFLVGRSIVRFPRWPRVERGLGALGDHTATHADLASLDAAGIRRELGGGRLAVREAGAGDVALFRPPYGIHPPAVDAEARRQGLVEVLWSIDSGDSDFPAEDFHQISRHVRENARPGAIVLMHENRGQTIRALRAVLPWLHRHHLRSVSLPTLLADDPPTHGQLRHGRAGCPPERGLAVSAGS